MQKLSSALPKTEEVTGCSKELRNENFIICSTHRGDDKFIEM